MAMLEVPPVTGGSGGFVRGASGHWWLRWLRLRYLRSRVAPLEVPPVQGGGGGRLYGLAAMEMESGKTSPINDRDVSSQKCWEAVLIRLKDGCEQNHPGLSMRDSELDLSKAQICA